MDCRPYFVDTGVHGTVLGIAVNLSALPYFLRLFPSPYRAGVLVRSVLVGSDCTSRRGAISRASAHSRSEKQGGVDSGTLARPSSQRGRLETELEAGVVPPRSGLPVEDWIVLLSYRLGIWDGP